MAQIEIEADDTELIDIKLVGQDYLINPPKTSLTIGMARTLAGKKVVKLPKDATDAQKEAAQQEQAKLGKEALDALDTWVRQAFGKEGFKAIKKRLADPDDRLDTPHLMDLMAKVSELVTGDPTT